MPPAFRNHLVPTGCDTPAATAASSLLIPVAIASQNRRRSSRPAIGGRPGDGSGARPDRSDRRFRMLITTSSFRVLRRPFESVQYCSIEYQAVLRKHGLAISMSGKGNCYDNAVVETFFKTLKSEIVWRTVFQTRAEAKDALGRYIDGFYNPVRRHSTLDYLSPVQFEKLAG
jgi:putative transposase